MNSFKLNLAKQQTVSLVNADHPCSGLVDFVAKLRIDAFMLDCEQGNIGFLDIEEMTRAAHLHEVSSIVRVPSPESWIIERYMMRGIDGLVIPRLDYASQVSKAIKDIRYCCPKNFEEKSIIIQVESDCAVKELDGFLKVPEVDCFFIGAVDLAKSMGYRGDYSQPEVMVTINEVIMRILDKGRCVGFMVKEHDIQFWQKKGVTMLYTHVNDFLSIGASQWLKMANLTSVL